MATTTTIDETTAAAIRRALASAAAGKLAEACEIGERALAQGGEPGPLHAMLGMLRCRSGNMEQGVGHLEAAYAANPADLVIANNLGSALAELGRYGEGLNIVTDGLARADKSLKLMKLRGFLAQMSDDFELATRCYEQVVSAVPDDWESWNNLGNARRRTEDFDGSADALARALELNPGSPPIQLNYASALVFAGRFDEAERRLKQMAADFPLDAKPLCELHRLYKYQARNDEALEPIEAAVAREPDDVGLWLALASHRLMLLQHAAAEEAYREAIQREPGNALANIGLSAVFELTNRADELTALVDEAAARGTSEDALNFIRAFDHRRRKRFTEGLAALSKVPETLETARRAHLLGQLEEGAGHFDEAFEAFERMNEIAREDPSRPEERAATYRGILQRQAEMLTPEWVSRWTHVGVDERPSPVFLIGFPRSGTTLLDTILMGHPDIEVMEEEPALRHAHEAMPDFASIPGATHDLVQAARDRYFDTAGQLTTLRPGKLLIDKNPLGTVALPLIHRLFPDARIILALRHPYDVVLSCFITNFKLNDGMANFLRLETAAEFYDVVFSYFERSRELWHPQVHTIYYENIVEDRDRELRPLFDFLGLDWHDAVLDHQATARGRGHIKTASYAQVVEPIYKRAAGRWHNYRKHLEPVIPVLRPWAEKFGYET